MTENSAKSIISKNIDMLDLDCQPTELQKADVRGHCRDVASRSFSDLLDEISKEIEKEFQQEIARWGNVYITRALETRKDWILEFLQKKKQELEK